MHYLIRPARDLNLGPFAPEPKRVTARLTDGLSVSRCREIDIGTTTGVPECGRKQSFPHCGGIVCGSITVRQLAFQDFLKK